MIDEQVLDDRNCHADLIRIFYKEGGGGVDVARVTHNQAARGVLAAKTGS